MLCLFLLFFQKARSRQVSLPHTGPNSAAPKLLQIQLRDHSPLLGQHLKDSLGSILSPSPALVCTAGHCADPDTSKIKDES